MSYEALATIIFGGSILGMGLIMVRKIPILIELPEDIKEPKKEGGLLFEFKNKVKNLPLFKSFSYEIFLQKILSKMRILFLRGEAKIGNLLQKLREKSQAKKIKENDNYWQELKKSTDQEKPPENNLPG